jgi:hypothetical protein
MLNLFHPVQHVIGVFDIVAVRPGQPGPQGQLSIVSPEFAQKAQACDYFA